MHRHARAHTERGGKTTTLSYGLSGLLVVSFIAKKNQTVNRGQLEWERDINQINS